jgi:uncharacterized protein YdaU (DUF1376 family)
LHYYTFNIGDYRRDTSHLTLLEHGIYRQLIDSYYLGEQPLCADDAILMRTHSIRTQEEEKAFRNVMNDFFERRDDGYHHRGCEKNIEQYRSKSKKASDSAKARWEKDAEGMRTHSKRNANGMLTNNHKPITNNHKPIKKLPAPEGVSSEVWDSFLQQRQKTRAVVTETVIKTIQKEADLAGWPLEKALAEIVARGWRGFKAEWVKDKQENKLLTFAERDEQLKRKRWEEMTGRKWPEPGQPVERLQIL